MGQNEHECFTANFMQMGKGGHAPKPQFKRGFPFKRGGCRDSLLYKGSEDDEGLGVEVTG